MTIGILGAGKIGPKFAKDALTLPDVSIGAIGSRSLERAEAMARELGAVQAFGSYEDFLDKADVDLVYIATPHVAHCELTLACLERGLPVLVEKAFAVNVREADQMITLAREKKVFLMEAMWSRFIPSIRKAKEWLDEGLIGELCSIRADFGFKAKYDPNSRLFNPALGGGALLDIGIYPVFLAYLTGGMPEEIRAEAIFGETGVDEELGMVFRYANHLAYLESSFRATTPCTARISGREGAITIHSRWHHSSRVSVSFHNGQSGPVWESDAPWIGYRYEAAHVQQCLREGRTESPLWSLDDSRNLMSLLDEIREMIGLQYPQD